MSKLDFNAEIKSANAECLLNAAKQSNIYGCPVPLSVAIRAVIIAETELTESHAKELQELKDKTAEQHKQHCTNSRCPSFSNWRNQTCSCNCEYMKSFLTELNK